MSNPEQSLSLLLPSLSDNLPRDLTALSNSLLAQSRTNASNLKPEEEIARAYACSEIACKRLSTKLQLPALRGRPPCAPRVYKKLLTFLEQALPAKLPTRPTQESSSKASNGDNGVSAKSSSTPRRAAATRSQPTLTTTPKKRTSTFAGKIAQTDTTATHDLNNDDGAPEWAMPLIRRLCHTFSTPRLPPHVYTGLCIVLSLADLEPDQTPTYKRDVLGLTLALFFMVLARMQKGKVSSESYVRDCEKACAVANENDDEDGAGTVISKEHVDAWIKRISSENWTTGQDWWSSVPENVFSRAEKPEEEVEDEHEEQLINGKRRRRIDGKMEMRDTEQDPEHILLPGLGTMMQESVDWMSEDRRAEYLDWRARIEKRLGGMERSKQGRTRVRAR